MSGNDVFYDWDRNLIISALYETALHELLFWGDMARRAVTESDFIYANERVDHYRSKAVEWALRD